MDVNALRSAPWKDESEFRKVQALVYMHNDDIDKLRAAQLEGLALMKTWMTFRSCPAFVDSTHGLLEAFLQENLGSGYTSSICLQFAAAFIRFVNATIDPLQQSMFAKSMNALAAEVQLPPNFVELRHACTHEDLPSLKVMRTACHQALNWLHTRFWNTQFQNDDQETHPETLDQHMRARLEEILGIFKDSRKVAARDVTKRDMKREEKMLDYIQSQTTLRQRRGSFESSRGEDNDLRMLVSILVEKPGMLVPVASKKRSSGLTQDLSASLLDIWRPLIEHMERSTDFVDVLAFHILSVCEIGALEEGNEAHNNGLAQSYYYTLWAWLRYLALTFMRATGSLSTLVQTCFLSRSDESLTFVRWVVGLRLLPVDIELQIAELLRINDIIPEKVENSHEKCAYERVEAERANNGLEAELKAIHQNSTPPALSNLKYDQWTNMAQDEFPSSLIAFGEIEMGASLELVCSTDADSAR